MQNLMQDLMQDLGALVDDGGECPRALLPRQGFRMLAARGGGSPRPVMHEERSMSAIEKEQPEAAKTRFAKDQLKAFVERIEAGE